MIGVIRPLVRVLSTLAVVGIAVWLGLALWDAYMISPWTRDGRVRAYVVNAAPEVAGTVVEMPLHDNQFVHRGDVLFRVDPAGYRIAVDQAQARLDGARVDLELRRSDARRRRGLGGAVSAEEQEIFDARVQTQTALVNGALADLALAKLNLERATVYATVDGFVTNLNLRVGDYAAAGEARLAVLDAGSFWIYGYFEETKMWGVHVGDTARVKLMGYRSILPAHVVSITRGIDDRNGASDRLGLPDVSPIFTWVRLAQRIPVRLQLDRVPPDLMLAAGMTCTVTVGPASRGRRGRLASWLQDHL